MSEIDDIARERVAREMLWWQDKLLKNNEGVKCVEQDIVAAILTSASLQERN